jgi:hypothetical protein
MFGHWLMGAIRPRIVVELGVHDGLSYLTFCQAVVDWHLAGTKCYGVDHWKGDDGTGPYDGVGMLDGLKKRHKSYEGFSTLCKSSFADARHVFDDGSVDLLHIDGMHSYEAVKSDWETWKTALAPDGICLFHDSAVPHFGVKDVVRAIRASGKRVFEFHHGFGLAVVANGRIRDSMAPLFGSEAEQEASRKAFQCAELPQRGVIRRPDMSERFRWLILSHDPRMVKWCQDGLLWRGRGTIRHLMCGAQHEFQGKLAEGYNLLAQTDAHDGGTSGDILGFIHHDSRLLFDWERLIPAYMESVGPKCGVIGFVGNEQISGDLPCWWGRWGVGGLYESWEREKHRRRFAVPPVRGTHAGHELRWQQVQVLDCACLIVRRSVFDSVGGFSAYLPGWHLHDIDFTLKVHNAGYINACIEEPLWHVGGALIGTGPQPEEWQAFRRAWSRHLGLLT